MNHDELRAAIRAAILGGAVELDLDMERLVDELITGANESDEALGAKVRAHLPIIGLSLLAIKWSIERAANARPKRGKGRPRVKPELSKDAFRAYRAWCAARLLIASGIDPAPTVKAAIALARRLESKVKPDTERAFPPTVTDHALEQSVRQGRATLGFPYSWDSPECEEILRAH